MPIADMLTNILNSTVDSDEMDYDCEAIRILWTRAAKTSHPSEKKTFL